MDAWLAVERALWLSAVLENQLIERLELLAGADRIPHSTLIDLVRHVRCEIEQYEIALMAIIDPDQCPSPAYEGPPLPPSSHSRGGRKPGSANPNP